MPNLARKTSSNNATVLHACIPGIQRANQDACVCCCVWTKVAVRVCACVYRATYERNLMLFMLMTCMML